MNTNRLRWTLLIGLLVPCWVIAMHYDIDLVNLFAAAGFTHTDLSRIYAQNGNLGRYFYPPFSLVLIYPFGALTYPTVKGIWLLLQTISYGFFWMGLHRLFPYLTTSIWAWLIVFILAINPIHNNYQSNNIQLMLIAMLVMAEVLTQQGKRSEFFAGILVALASWIKVFPAFMAIYYIIAKPMSAKLGVVAGFIVGLVLPFFFFGITPGITLYRDFYAAVTTYSNENSLLKSVDIMCLPSLLERLLTYLLPVSAERISLIIKGTVLGISTLFFAYTLYAIRTKRLFIEQNQNNQPNQNTPIYFWSMAMALTVFLNPSTRPHYFIFYVPAAASLLQLLSTRHSRVSLTFLGIAVLLVAFTTDAILGKLLNDRVEFLSLPTIGTAILCALLAVAIVRQGEPQAG